MRGLLRSTLVCGSEALMMPIASRAAAVVLGPTQLSTPIAQPKVGEGALLLPNHDLQRLRGAEIEVGISEEESTPMRVEGHAAFWVAALADHAHPRDEADLGTLKGDSAASARNRTDCPAIPACARSAMRKAACVPTARQPHSRQRASQIVSPAARRTKLWPKVLMPCLRASSPCDLTFANVGAFRSAAQ